MIGSYINGNTNVYIYEDGTKIRQYEDCNNVYLWFPECIDVNITNQCNQRCKYCYQNATPDGMWAELDSFKSLIDQMHPFTEIAINGNDVTNPLFVQMLQYAQSKQIIVNVTVNQSHFSQNYKWIYSLTSRNLIRGLGVSLIKPTKRFINQVMTIPNAVIHTIAGITTLNDYNLISQYSNCKAKVLILGYKTVGRGVNYKAEHNDDVIDNINKLRSKLQIIFKRFAVVSFDNLAVEQLNVQSVIDDWDKFYMGDDGQYTFYVDLVTSLCYSSSMQSKLQIGLKLTNNNLLNNFQLIRKGL